jgi:hypothetical protein
MIARPKTSRNERKAAERSWERRAPFPAQAPLRGPSCPARVLALRNLTAAALAARHALADRGKPASDAFRTWEFRDGGGFLEGLAASCLGAPVAVDASVDVDILRLPLAAKLRGLKSAWLKARRRGDGDPAAVAAFERIAALAPPGELCPSLGFCGCSPTGADCV